MIQFFLSGSEYMCSVTYRTRCDATNTRTHTHPAQHPPRTHTNAPTYETHRRRAGVVKFGASVDSCVCHVPICVQRE